MSKDLVEYWMTPEPITISTEGSYFEALKLMQEGRFRRLPVEHFGALVGIVTDRDIKEAAPSDALVLRADELNKLLDGLKTGDIMTKPVFTIQAEDSIEAAALLMHNKKISGLPVLKSGKIVGIITTTNILEAFIELLSLDKGKKLFAVSDETVL